MKTAPYYARENEYKVGDKLILTEKAYIKRKNRKGFQKVIRVLFKGEVVRLNNE